MNHPDPVLRDLCFVLKSFPYKDRDIIAVLFSETRGRFSSIARNGVQSRRFGGCLDLFTASDFEIEAKTIRLSEVTDENLVRILSATSRHHFSSLCKTFEKLSAASCLNEIIIKGLPSHRPAPEIFKLYSNCLAALEEMETEKAVAVVNAFILKFTQWLGMQPSLTRCLSCGKPLNEVRGDEVFSQIAQGAWQCVDCTHDRGTALSKTVIYDAYQAMLNPIRKTTFEACTADHEKLLDFLEHHLMYFVPGLDKTPLTSTRFLKSFQSPL